VHWPARALFVPAALCLLYLEPVAVGVGFCLLAVSLHAVNRTRSRAQIA
jgi:hypothetical protein